MSSGLLLLSQALTAADEGHSEHNITHSVWSNPSTFNPDKLKRLVLASCAAVGLVTAEEARILRLRHRSSQIGSIVALKKLQAHLLVFVVPEAVGEDNALALVGLLANTISLVCGPMSHWSHPLGEQGPLASLLHLFLGCWSSCLPLRQSLGLCLASQCVPQLELDKGMAELIMKGMDMKRLAGAGEQERNGPHSSPH